MFKSRNKNPKTLRIDTLVGAGTRVVGDMHFKGGLHVDGTIQGNVESVPGAPATLSISDSGVIEGLVKVANVVLNGTVNGDIYAAERVELGATAKVSGNVHYAMIEMAMGAQINGKLIHHSPDEPGPVQGTTLMEAARTASGAELGYTGTTA